MRNILIAVGVVVCFLILVPIIVGAWWKWVDVVGGWFDP